MEYTIKLARLNYHFRLQSKAWRFGPYNTGFKIVANNLDEVRQILAKEHNLNMYYCVVCEDDKVIYNEFLPLCDPEDSKKMEEFIKNN